MSLEDCKRIVHTDIVADATANREMFSEYVRTRNIDIRNQIIMANIRLAADVALHMCGGKNDRFDDYYSVACEALVRATEGFNPAFGVEFSTYAFEAIKNSILMEQKRDVRRASHSADVQFTDEDQSDEDAIEILFADNEDNPERIMIKRVDSELLARAFRHLSYRSEIAVRCKLCNEGNKIFCEKFDCSRELYRIVYLEGLRRMRNMLEWDFSLASIFGFRKNCPNELVERRLATFPKNAQMFLCSAFGLHGFKKLDDKQLHDVYLNMTETKIRNVHSVLQILTRGLSEDISKLKRNVRPIRSINVSEIKSKEEIVENLVNIGALPNVDKCGIGTWEL